MNQWRLVSKGIAYLTISSSNCNSRKGAFEYWVLNGLCDSKAFGGGLCSYISLLNSKKNCKFFKIFKGKFKLFLKKIIHPTEGPFLLRANSIGTNQYNPVCDRFLSQSLVYKKQQPPLKVRFSCRSRQNLCPGGSIIDQYLN